jgi:nucleoid-associated protein YgaU
VGLLLGLVFMFVVAFVINGLPSFRNATNSNELTTNMVSSQNDTLGIGTKERKVQEGFDWTGQAIEEPVQEVRPTAENNGKGRFKMQIPDDIAVLADASSKKTLARIELSATEAVKPVIQEQIAAEPAVPEPVAPKITEIKRPTSPKPAAPKVYIVQDGDNLAEIAKKFYGSEEGNKRANIERIFEANRKLLKSIDEIIVGQKLVVPALKVPGKSTSAVSGSMFEVAKSIGRKYHPTNKPKAKQGRQYVVQEGDNLWRIAVEQLGDGSRYKEISKLNEGLLEDEESLSIGMSLTLPAR